MGTPGSLFGVLQKAYSLNSKEEDFKQVGGALLQDEGRNAGCFMSLRVASGHQRLQPCSPPGILYSLLSEAFRRGGALVRGGVAGRVSLSSTRQQ